jgi:hypothetical protein
VVEIWPKKNHIDSYLLDCWSEIDFVERALLPNHSNNDVSNR